jgi:hypothetical protein
MSYLKRVGMLSKNEIAKICLLALKGYTFQEIAVKFNCSTSKIYKYYQYHNNFDKIIIHLKGKDEPYYYNEDMYGCKPVYKYEDLSYKEQLIYNRL